MTAKTISLAQAADALGVHYMTVYRYVRTGRLPAVQRGGTWQIEPDDLKRLRPSGRQVAGRRTTGRSAPLEHLERRLLAGDEAGSWALLESELSSGAVPDALLLDLIGPVLASVGDRWRQGELTVADEHRASAVAARLVSRLGGMFARRGRKRGAVVLAAAEGDLHGTPVAMAADLLRWRGFEVVELGADTPADALAEMVACHPGVIATGLACTLPSALDAVGRAFATVRSLSPSVALFAGGSALTGPEQAVALGADHYSGPRGDGVVRVVEAVADAAQRRHEAPPNSGAASARAD